MWLNKVTKDLSNSDLFIILSETLLTNRLSYLNILKNISEGYGVTSSEGNGFGLDQNWDFSEDFNEVTFFFGEMESSSISPADFINQLLAISEYYILDRPDDKDKVYSYLHKIKKRYNII